MSEKIAFVSDLHLGRYFKTNKIKYNKIKDSVFKLYDYIRTNHPEIKTIINAGDTIHSPNFNSGLLLEINKILKNTFSEKTFSKIYTIRGNHEVVFMDSSKINSRTILELLIPSSETARLNECSTMIIDNCNFIFLPWDIHENILFKLEKNVKNIINPKLKNILVSHFTPQEIFSFGNVDLTSFVKENPEISHIFLGDYHDPVDLKIENTEIFSIGSPYPQTTTEIKSLKNKRLLIIDTDTGEVVSEDLPFGIPKCIEINTHEEYKEFLETASEECSYLIYSKVFLDDIEHSDNLDITIENISKQNVKIMEDLKTIKLTSLSPQELFDSFISQLDIPEDDKKSLTSIFNLKNPTSDELYNLL